MTAADDHAERLAQVCWCDTNVRWVLPAVVRSGEGWSCHPLCLPGCRPGVGRKPTGPLRRRYLRDDERTGT